jgi:hypothetical protein
MFDVKKMSVAQSASVPTSAMANHSTWQTGLYHNPSWKQNTLTLDVTCVSESVVSIIHISEAADNESSSCELSKQHSKAFPIRDRNHSTPGATKSHHNMRKLIRCVNHSHIRKAADNNPRHVNAKGMPNPRPYQHTTVGMQINLIGKQYSKAIPFAKNKHSHRLLHHHSS